MTYTEVKEKNGKKYYYRVKSVRNGNKFKKDRIYLGKNLSKKELSKKEVEADKKLTMLESIISYLREKEIRYSEIARLLNRDQRNVWTIYSRAVKKIGN